MHFWIEHGVKMPFEILTSFNIHEECIEISRKIACKIDVVPKLEVGEDEAWCFNLIIQRLLFIREHH